MCDQSFDIRLGAKYRRAVEQEVHAATKTVDVGTGVDPFRVVRLFRRHVVDGTDDISGCRDIVVLIQRMDKVRQAEIGDFELSLFAEQ